MVVANYKMNGDRKFYSRVLKVVNKYNKKDTKIILCPPFVYIPFMKLKSANLGAQDISSTVNNKSTGQIGPSMLKEFGVKYTLVGHSERRAEGETDETVAMKVKTAVSHDLVPIICVGEEKKGDKIDIVSTQVEKALSLVDKGEIIFAYEPVWAIGSGIQPTTKQINKAISTIKKVASKSGHEVKVLYGGSVNGNNFSEIVKTDADGYLLGGVSNRLDEFASILKEMQ